MSKMIFVNLPEEDLAAATRFYETIGCKKKEQFSDEKAASMVWSDTITFQLLTREYFASFTSKQVADAHGTCQVMLALTCDTREDADTISEAAGAAGGKTDVRERLDMGWLYNRVFEDTDGHVFQAVWMDMKTACEMSSKQ